MNVQDLPPEHSKEARAEDAHESRKTDQLRSVLRETIQKGPLEVFPDLKSTVFDHLGRQPSSAGALERVRARHVGDHERDLRRIFGARGGIDQRLKVAAMTRYQHGDAQLGIHGSNLQALIDRKSTRLNSSHTVISYA